MRGEIGCVRARAGEPQLHIAPPLSDAWLPLKVTLTRLGLLARTTSSSFRTNIGATQRPRLMKRRLGKGVQKHANHQAGEIEADAKGRVIHQTTPSRQPRIGCF